MVEKEKTPLAILRESRGGIPDSLRDATKEQNRIHKLIKEALKASPMTVPQLAVKINVPSETTMWHLMAMKRYGDVYELGRDGDYYKYALTEK
jgi:predicted transcriptional regulator